MYIDDPRDELFDVATSDMLITMEEIDDSFNFDDSLTEELDNEDINLIEKV